MKFFRDEEKRIYYNVDNIVTIKSAGYISSGGKKFEIELSNGNKETMSLSAIASMKLDKLFISSDKL